MIACRSSIGGDGGGKNGVPNSNYVVPLDKSFSYTNSSYITRPLAKILRDLNKRIPDNIIQTPPENPSSTFIPWYHANRMLSFYALGWCGEICDVIFSDNGSVTVVYRVTVRGSDGKMKSNKFRIGMDFFHKAKAVHLRSHYDKYLLAEENDESVTQERNGSSTRARWTIKVVTKTDNII
ncbi:hypothetical protein TB2_002477 [Malus domestica]|uniref:DUF569 domain-containing protein n=1 Tax=Malus domestica TaxID=3750 RepID=A0A498IQI9_MALDO|nr:hypothetical protein DVH24_009341 [Malus domestica]